MYDRYVTDSKLTAETRLMSVSCTAATMCKVGQRLVAVVGHVVAVFHFGIVTWLIVPCWDTNPTANAG